MQAAMHKRPLSLRVDPTNGKGSQGRSLPEEEPEGSEDVMISFGQVPEEEERGTPAMLFPTARRLAPNQGENACKFAQA